MGKKKNKPKFRPADLDNLPSRSSISKKIAKKSDDVNNTSSELSETSSKANESIDSFLSAQSCEEVSNESKNDIKDDSCEPLSTDDDHKASENVALARDDLTSCNTYVESTECASTGQCADEVANKLQNVTIDSQSARNSDSNNYTRKTNYNRDNNAWRRNSNDHSGRNRNYTNNDKLSFDSGRSNRFNQQADHYNHRNQNKYESKSREFRNRNFNNIQGRENSKQELDRSKVKYEPKYHDSTSGSWKVGPFEQRPNIRNNTFSKEVPADGGRLRYPSDLKSKSHEIQTECSQNEEENWDNEVQNVQEAPVENETAITKEGDTSSNNSLLNNTSWDDDTAVLGTGLNADAESFVPTGLPRQDMPQISKDEEDHTKYTTTGENTDDHIFNNQHKPERQERRGAGWGQKQHRKSDYDEDRQNKEATHYSRNYYSEGDGWSRNEKRQSKPSFHRSSEKVDEEYRKGDRWGRNENRQSRSSFDRSSEKVDAEYRKFQDEERKGDKIEFVRVVEIQQDLFAVAKEYSLAHCVAEDMRMGSGIAVSFKRDFKDLDVLLSQRQKQGGLAVLENKTDEGVRYIYYLVTKRVSTGKPTYETLWSSLKKMRDHIREQDVRKLAIPRLGCGLDRLEWSRVKHMIEFLFKDVEVEITVCNFQQIEDAPEKPLLLDQTCKVVHAKKPIADIEEETAIIYLSTEDGHVSTEMDELNKKFSFLDEFKRARKQLGFPIKFDVPKKYYVLYGCIVRKTKSDPFDFVSFRKCVSAIGRNCKKDGYVYVGIQAIKDDNDDLINDKLITILRNYLHKINVYICWDGDLVGQMPIIKEFT